MRACDSLEWVCSSLSEANVLVTYDQADLPLDSVANTDFWLHSPWPSVSSDAVVQICSAEKWAWTAMLDDVIQCVLEYVRICRSLSLSLSLSGFLGGEKPPKALNLLRRKASCLSRFSLSSTTASFREVGGRAA